MAKRVDRTRVRAAEERLVEHSGNGRKPGGADRALSGGQSAVETMEMLMVEPFKNDAVALVPLTCTNMPRPWCRCWRRTQKCVPSAGCREAVLQLAVLHGLEVLEQRYQRRPNPKPSGDNGRHARRPPPLVEEPPQCSPPANSRLRLHRRRSFRRSFAMQ